MMRPCRRDAARHRCQPPSQGGKIVATACAMMVLGLLGGKEAAAFLGPARNGLSEQVMVTPGSTASAPFAAASSFPQPRTAEVVAAGTLATKAFWVLSLLAGACSFRKTAASR